MTFEGSDNLKLNDLTQVVKEPGKEYLGRLQHIYVVKTGGILIK